MNPSKKLRLLIVDDHAVVREGLEAMLGLDSGIGQIAMATNQAETEECCASFIPDVVLLDVRMPHTDGFSVLQSILRRWPTLRVIMLSASALPSEVKLARQYGAVGYLPKSAGRKSLLSAIYQISQGMNCFQTAQPEATLELNSLSARELEVLIHLGRGLSNEDIGRVLSVSAETIKSHLKAIFSKLEVGGRTEAVTRAYELGLLSVQ